MAETLNAFTVDLEDWYQGLEIESSMWQQFESRIETGIKTLLSILDEYQVKATFFVLGHLAERYPELIKKIAGLGHDIGSHGYSHTMLYKLTPTQFRDELKRSKGMLEGLCGKKVTCFRAPFFSITRDSLWALDILSEEGFSFDSSIFPVHNYRYGIPEAPRSPFTLTLENRRTIREFPISVHRLAGVNLPFSGGAYFRLLPYRLTHYCIKRVNGLGLPVVFYIHPWELDPHHPRINLPRRISLTHYARLSSTKKKLEKLLKHFKFTSLTGALEQFGKGKVIFSKDFLRI